MSICNNNSNMNNNINNSNPNDDHEGEDNNSISTATITDSSNSNSRSSSFSNSTSEEQHQPQYYELFQLEGTINSNNLTSFEYDGGSDHVILIPPDSSTKSKYYSSLTWFQTFKKNFSKHNKNSQKEQQKVSIIQTNDFSNSNEVHSRRNMKLKQRWILATFIIVAIVILLLCTLVLQKNKNNNKATYSQQLGITINLDELTERLKCPACYGVNICPQILSGKIYLNDWNKFSISKLVNSKNIFYATWNDDQGNEKQVVLKKLAHNHELADLDKAICDRHGQDHICDVRQAVISLIDTYSHKLPHHGPDDPLILHGEKIGTGSDLLLCPSHRKMEYLIKSHAKFARGQHYNTILANVLTTILLNPEPLYLQAFPAEDGWPFPQYNGACGRIISEEYVGRRLTTYYNEPFVIRAFIAKQLLEIANKFNENPTNFILYLTDITPDNFAVEEHTNIVKVVDLENLIMVDKELLVQSKVSNHEKLLVAESSYCKNEGNAENMCFSFSTDDLCERPRTDHNYYAICAGLLAPTPLADEFPQGLLHSAPSELKDDTNFLQILEVCKNPSTAANFTNIHLKNRIQAAQTLIELLGNYLKSHNLKK